jgi:pyridoxine kinase
MFNDFAGFGRCSATVALPVISTLGVQVCPVPTSILSNHLGFPLCHFDDYTPHIHDYIRTWKALGLSFDGLYCGFLGSVEQICLVEEFLSLFSPGFFLLDPVMGDHGRTYSSVTAAHCDSLKGLAGRADILTPNLTEACLLADIPYTEEPSERDIDLLCVRLKEKYPHADIVITGIAYGRTLLNIILTGHEKITCAAPAAGASRPGTGDIFASILSAEVLSGKDLSSAVKKAADFISLCIRESEAAGTPVQEGVLLERCLKYLNQ